MRTHVVLDKELVDAIDEIAGKRKRSQFIEEAVRAKLRRERLGRAMAAAKGSIDPKDYPYWATPELTSQWVHDMRQADQAYINARSAAHQRQRDRHVQPDSE